MNRVRIAALALAGLGFVVACYLTVTHFTANVPGCPLGGGIVNCENVLTSTYSTIGPVPVSLFGAIWFAIMALFILKPTSLAPLPALRLWTWIGTLTVLWLVYTELFLVGSVCVWCSSVHLIVLILLVLEETGSLSRGD